jgi:hypothetical protein
MAKSKIRRAPSDAAEDRAEKRERKARARSRGKVWVEVSIDGRGVSRDGVGPIGQMTMNGPLSPDQAFVLWMAAKGLSPAEIAEEVASFIKPGGEKESRKGRRSSLLALLQAIHDLRPAEVETLPLGLREEHLAWAATGFPGLG